MKFYVITDDENGTGITRKTVSRRLGHSEAASIWAHTSGARLTSTFIRPWEGPSPTPGARLAQKAEYGHAF